MPVEPPLGAVEVALGDGEPLTVAPDEAPDPVLAKDVADGVEDEGAGKGAEGGGEDGGRQPEPPLAGEEAGEGEDDLGGDGGEDVLEGDQDGDADVAEALDDVGDPAGEVPEGIGHDGVDPVPKAAPPSGEGGAPAASRAAGLFYRPGGVGFEPPLAR